MNDRNLVENTALLRNKYNSFLKSFGLKPQSHSSINKFFYKLNKLPLLIKMAKGQYQINPIFFCNGDEEMRAKLIREYLEQPLQDEIKAYRHTMLSRKKNP